MVLHRQLCGRVGSCPVNYKALRLWRAFSFSSPFACSSRGLGRLSGVGIEQFLPPTCPSNLLASFVSFQSTGRFFSYAQRPSTRTSKYRSRPVLHATPGRFLLRQSYEENSINIGICGWTLLVGRLGSGRWRWRSRRSGGRWPRRRRRNDGPRLCDRTHRHGEPVRFHERALRH